jgi:hypothetical protein
MDTDSEKTLLFDIFTSFKEFDKPATEIDPYKLPLASSVYTTIAIIGVYLLILYVGKL